jgi:hypothetical protein
LHAQRHLDEKVDRKSTLQVDERPSRRRQTAPRCPPQLVRKVNQGIEQARVFELAQQGSVFFGQARWQRSELAAKGLRVAITSAGAFTHSDAIAISVTATPCV